MFTLLFFSTGNLDINTSLQERFADANRREIYLHDARSILEENPKSLMLCSQQKAQEGLSNVEAERQSFALRQISYGNEKASLFVLFSGWSLTEQEEIKTVI